jgi:hypothetical protein
MLRRDPTYRRLKAGGYGPFGSSSYWLGPDHLLVVVMASYAESYRRFLLSDIQAFVVTRNKARLLWGSGFGLLAVPSLVGGLALTSSQPIAAGIMLGLAGLFGALLLVNWLRGPTCSCSLWTAVQSSPLPNITRWRRAEALLKELTPRVLEAQAGLVPGEMLQPPVEAAPADPAPTNPVLGETKYVIDDPNAPPRILS